MKEKMTIDKELAAFIKLRIETLLLQTGKTREDVAKAAKIDIATLSKKMNGYVNWKLPECISIARLFGVELSYIFLPDKLQKSIERR